MKLDQLHFFTAPISSLLVAVSVIVNQTTGFYNLFFLIRQMHCPAIHVCPLQELTARPDDRTDIGLERTRPSGGRGGFYLFSFISIQ